MFGSSISPYGQNVDAAVNQIKTAASNIVGGENPAYTVADFIEAYPGFGPGAGPQLGIVFMSVYLNPDYLVPLAILQMYINLANACIKKARYHTAWQICMGFFVAHFATLYLEGMAAAGSPAGKVLEAGKARGLRTSESVGDVSASYDYNAIGQDLDGWAAWKLTVYGQQLATIGKMVGKGGMMIW